MVEKLALNEVEGSKGRKSHGSRAAQVRRSKDAIALKREILPHPAGELFHPSTESGMDQFLDE